MIEKVRKTARRWLEEGQVDAFIGFRRRTDGTVIPVRITDPGKADQLYFGDGCLHNLMSYVDLGGKEKIGVLLKGCDGRALVQLLAEDQIQRERIKVLGVVCPGLQESGELARKCRACSANTPPLFDELLQGEVEPWERSEKSDELVAMESRTPSERMSFFREQFDRCIRCYACRDICPLCYCRECVTEKSQPQWVEVAVKTSSNFYWHLIRAFHLAGRCVECGECDRACPVGIPLRLLNEKMALQVKELFDYTPGTDPEAQPVLLEFKEDEEHILDHGVRS
jgi:formate dehydrogenase subunit beta